MKHWWSRSASPMHATVCLAILAWRAWYVAIALIHHPYVSRLAWLIGVAYGYFLRGALPILTEPLRQWASQWRAHSRR